MRIQYILADGQEIDYTCVGDVPTMADIDNLAKMYAQKCPKSLPDSVFISVRIYGDMMSSFYNPTMFQDRGLGMNLVHIHSSVGVLKIIPVPYASDAKLILVGQRHDFDRYDIDKIFEEIVLKDCEREE